MAITEVQEVPDDIQAFLAATPVNFTIAAPSVGNYLVIRLTWTGDNTAAAPTLSATHDGGAFSEAANGQAPSFPGIRQVNLYRKVTGTSTTVSIESSTAGNAAVVISEYSGVHATNPIMDADTASANSNTITVPDLTLTGNALVLSDAGWASWENSTEPATHTLDHKYNGTTASGVNHSYVSKAGTAGTFSGGQWSFTGTVLVAATTVALAEDDGGGEPPAAVSGGGNAGANLIRRGRRGRMVA